jgi:uncharacterized protein (DUF2062 family)
MSKNDNQRPVWAVRFWRKKVRGPVLQELQRGISPAFVAFAVVLGLASATWPQIGTNPFMALLLAWATGANRLIVSGVSLVFTPLQYMFMIPFLRFGESLLGLPHFQTTVPEIVTIVVTDPIGSFSILGLPLLHAILGWVVAWVVIGPMLFVPCRRLMHTLAPPRG